jgi:hypothetical protein
LRNEGKQAVTIWDYKNAEGSQCAGVLLTDENGKDTILLPPPITRYRGTPTVITLAPHQAICVDLELPRLIGEHGLPPGPYQLKGFYENTWKNDGAVVEGEVWTGRIEGKAVKINICAAK